MNLYYEDQFRTESDQDAIAALLRKGWQECPAQPTYDATTQHSPKWDTQTEQWVVTNKTAEEIAADRAAQFPSATPRQVRIWLLRQGITSAMVESQISNTILDPSAQAEAIIAFEYSTGIERDNPLTVALATSLGYSANELDAEWPNILAI